jgi:polyisoprenyl-phosphate glycosyltransferase
VPPEAAENPLAPAYARSARPSIAVVAPVFDEEEVVEDFYRAVKAVLASLADRYDASILFVNDGSSDRTLDILERIARADPVVRLVSLSRRFGHQAALLAGIDHADADVVVTLDSDLQHPPELIPLLLQKFEEGYEVVYTRRQNDEEAGFLKRVTARLFYRLVNVISDVPILENAADFRLFSRRVATLFQTEIRERNQFLRGLFMWVGFRRTDVPFEARPRRAGRSKYSFGRMLQFATHGLLSFSRRPLQAAIYLGVAFALLGFASAALTLVLYFARGAWPWPPGWATLAILIPTFSGIQLIFLGILGQYIGAIFDEVKGRPPYIVDRTVNLGAGAGRRA